MGSFYRIHHREGLTWTYLIRILNAKVYDVAVETSLTNARLLSERLGNNVLIKREDEQPVFSFKLRGAYNKDGSPVGGAVGQGSRCCE